jgi:cytochrome c peroxidase
MWDGRETFPGQSIHFDLSDQANGATLGHAAAINPLAREQQDAIVNFEMSLYTAQSTDIAAGVLNTQGSDGGPLTLSRQPFYIGINDVLSPGFNPRAFTLFDAWRNLAAQSVILIPMPAQPSREGRKSSIRADSRSTTCAA